MNRFFLLFALISLFALTAAAGTVTFNTSGTQLCIGAISCGTNTITFGGTSITYVPSSNQTLVAPTFANLGDLIVYCTAGGTSCGPDFLPSNLTLYINVNQSVPSNGSGGIGGGMLTGAISGSSSSAKITWSSGAATTIGNVTYSISNSPLALVPPSNNNCGGFCPVAVAPAGKTTIQGFVSDVPEPGSILLLSTGLAGLILARRRRS